MNYKQLAQEERYQIYAFLKVKHNQKEIAQILRRVTASKHVKITFEVKAWIDSLLIKGFTPEQSK